MGSVWKTTENFTVDEERFENEKWKHTIVFTGSENREEVNLFLDVAKHNVYHWTEKLWSGLGTQRLSPDSNGFESGSHDSVGASVMTRTAQQHLLHNYNKHHRSKI